MMIISIYFDRIGKPYLIDDYLGWSPKDKKRWTALFQSLDVFQRWFREREKHQRWSALFQSWPTLITSKLAPFRTEKFSAVQERIIFELFLSEKHSVDILSSETLGFQRWFTLN